LTGFYFLPYYLGVIAILRSKWEVTGMKRLAIVLGILLSLLLLFGNTVTLAAPVERVNVLIGFDRKPGPAEQTLVYSFGGKIKYTYNIIPAIAASVPETAIKGLLNNPRVTMIEPDVTIHAIDAELDNSWGVKHIGASIVHSSGNKGNGIKVAILDTGIDYTNPDLQGKYIGGYDFVNGDGDPMDDNGHGTHVAGIIAALDDNDPDSGVVGVAPDVEIYALKVLDANGNGSFINVIAALDWVCGDSETPPIAQITNNSYGSTANPGYLVKWAFDLSYSLWGVLHVAAAGNSGNESGTGNSVEYPGKFTSVIAVAATDQNDNRASFSSTGPDVELAAPGVYINSTCTAWLDGSVYDGDGTKNGYAVLSGTSMASPHVAGTAALVMAAYPNWTNAQVRAQLRDTADDLGASGPDTWYGWGLVDADEAVGIITPVNQPPVADAGPDQTTELGQEITFDGSGSTDSEGNIVSYDWDFGDGSQATGVSVGHTYSKSGTYTAILTVTDDGGLTGTDTTTVTVNAPETDNVMYVADISMSLKTNTRGKNTFYYATAVVLVNDSNGEPVECVTVSGHWTGLTNDTDTGETNADGEVSLTSDSTKKTGAFTFIIDNLVKSGWIYEWSADDTGSVTVP
jgi:subtilisin family serine protease